MDTHATDAPTGKKEPGKRGATQKNLQTQSKTLDDDSGEDEVLELKEHVLVHASQAGRKGGEKAAGNAKTVKPPAATKKRGQASKQPKIGQKLLTEMLKPAEGSVISPEKKVRKMRASPFNKKSGSVLGRVGQKDKDPEIDESMGSASSTDNTEEVTETLPARARPQRAIRRQTTYVLSDSDSEKATDDSDFNVDEDD